LESRKNEAELEEFFMNKITVKIDGMMCGMCESHVSDAIRKAFPVKKVTASHAKGEAVILAEEPITEDQLRAAIAPTGYQVLSVAVEPYEKKGLFGFGKR
jgi:copper chaperone CopZ